MSHAAEAIVALFFTLSASTALLRQPVSNHAPTTAIKEQSRTHNSY
jgi:hypothetical protein